MLLDVRHLKDREGDHYVSKYDVRVFDSVSVHFKMVTSVHYRK